MTVKDITSDLQQQVNRAIERRRPLQIRGGNSKAFLGNTASGDVLNVSGHRGIVSYEPTELVITARCGTPLREIEATLAEQNQMLAFEPPHYADTATLGGTIACNLSGPRRPYAGAARDHVLGTRIINGKAEVLRFGGEVMKNVAGYDVSRLMTGAMGTLGVLLEVSLKVLPMPEAECTLSQTLSSSEAIHRMHEWSGRPYPVSATFYDGETLYVRISGAAAAVDVAARQMGGERHDATSVWQKLREHTHGFFQSSNPVWRLSLASDTAPLNINGKWLYEWGGALRWLASDAPANEVFAVMNALSGHATLYRNPLDAQAPRFQPSAGGLQDLHRQIKLAMDPAGVFNPGRFISGL